MKKLLALFLVLSLMFSLSACFLSDPEFEEDLALIEDILDAVVEQEQEILDSEVSSDALTDSTEPTTQATESDTQEPVTDGTEVASGESSSEDEISSEEETIPSEELPAETTIPEETEAPIAEDGSYTTKEDVALYIHTYGRLPENFITKNEARSLGWEGGSLEPYAPGKCIGGDRFGNYEGLLPTDRKYTECDIDTLGAKSRGAKRLVFSNDGLIYYTDDHYESFTLLYGEE